MTEDFMKLTEAEKLEFIKNLTPTQPEAKLCSILEPDCDSCQ